MSLVRPWMRTEPPSSASRPRPRTKIWFGASMRTSSRMPRRARGRRRGPRLPDPGAVEGHLHRRAAYGRGRPASSAACAWPPRPSAIEISVRPRSIRPESSPAPPTSGPLDRELAREPGGDEGAVGVAHVEDPPREVGRIAGGGVQRDPPLGGDPPAAGDAGAEAAQHGGVALEAGVEGDRLEAQVGLRVDEGPAVERDRAAELRGRERAARRRVHPRDARRLGRALARAAGSPSRAARSPRPARRGPARRAGWCPSRSGPCPRRPSPARCAG